MDKKQKAYAHFDAIRASLGRQQAAITALYEAGADTTALQAEHNQHHANLHAAWTDLLDEEGWAEEAGEANRSGGEDKPPQPPEAGDEGEGG